MFAENKLPNHIAINVAGRMLFMALFVLSGVTHFTNIPYYVSLMPESVPYPLFWIFLSGVVELAVENAQAEDIKNLGRLVEKMKGALKQNRIDDYSELDMTFHHQIANASHNRFMVHMFVTIRSMMEQFIREAFTVMPGLLERSLKFHVDIYEGIKQRNKRKAVTSMKNHIQDIEKDFRDYYNASENDQKKRKTVNE